MALFHCDLVSYNIRMYHSGLCLLSGAVKQPKKPFVAIVGGSKVSTKIPVIESLLQVADKVIIGGGMIFTFYKARGLSVGKSMVEEDKLDLAKKLEAMAKSKGVELLLPVDVVIADKFDANANAKVSLLNIWLWVSCLYSVAL